MLFLCNEAILIFLCNLPPARIERARPLQYFLNKSWNNSDTKMTRLREFEFFPSSTFLAIHRDLLSSCIISTFHIKKKNNPQTIKFKFISQLSISMISRPQFWHISWFPSSIHAFDSVFSLMKLVCTTSDYRRTTSLIISQPMKINKFHLAFLTFEKGEKSAQSTIGENWKAF